MNTRILVALAGGLAAGLLLGRAVPQADLRVARAEVERLQKQASSRPAAGRAALAGVENMLNVRSEEVAEVRRSRRHAHPDFFAAAAATNGAAPVATTTTTPARVAGPHSISNEIEQVKQAWQLRREIARKNFVERAALNESQTTAMDVVIEAMNIRLGESIDRWAAAIQKADEITPETGVRMMNELSSALVLTYDELDRKLPETWREKAGPKFELVQFVDPEVLTPLQDLGPIMQRAGDAPGAPTGEPVRP
jgi:hypothetical protein